jgi:ubiquinone/menaquinone biosynthesis C-methylase UbiE
MSSQPSHSPTSPPALDPRRILDMNYAFANTAMLVAAVRLHLFTHMSQKTLTPAALAELAHAAPGPIERLLKGLVVQGLLEREGDVYRLTSLADHFLVEGKPGYLGGDTLAMLDYLPAWFELGTTLCTGQPYRDLGDAATAETFFAPRVRDLFPLVHPIAKRTAAIVPLKMREHSLLVLDVGAGSAPWSAAFALKYPFAHVTALDLQAVVEQGQRQVDEMGLRDRYTWIEANMETWHYPAHSYDLVILAHVCRFIGEERARTLLGKLTKSLRIGGTLILADVFLSDDRSGPAAALTLDLSMLVNTSQGCISTCSEISAWLKDSGLSEIRRLEGVGPFPVVVAQKGESK